MVTAHDFHTATLLSDGKVLVAGGVINDRFDGWVSASAELYDPGSGSWTATTDMIEARWSHTATLLPDGRVLVTGSYINSGESRASAELYDPNSGSWTATRNMGEGRGGHTATMLPDGRVLVAGGYSGYNGYSMDSLASAELYDAGSGSWTATGDMAEARDGHTATLLPDGRVLVAGGRSSGGDALASAELYDPTSGRWTATGTMDLGRSSHTTTLLPDGRVLVAGSRSSGGDALASAELYDPGSGSWTATVGMIEARWSHTATLLPDGRVLMAAGRGNSRGNSSANDGVLASAELYDPGSRRWTAAGRMAEARDGHTATLLPDGRVLVAGDYNYESRASAELYDPSSGT